ncbi:Crp/Fnr family transcriptional regulator [Segetibacter sp.]|jgi:CRP-like cAMP-binding protein|uniref:Crp/Fnr family transcriptional regulator n=1 Tax=Segetibacter sp. TaxID=2231182 RepID=UPI0026280E66|nr:Crp/Fnr family transcriptional regulator [Segetibacter sp.]MCW3082551.1 cyclic nucleotide-binding protein [Segetibacter sp.]
MFELLHKKISAVTSVNEEDFDYFKTLFVQKKLRKRQYFLQEGDICKYQAFVEQGLLRSYTVDEKGSEHILQFASEGWWMADLSSYLTNEPSFLNVDALEEVELLLITKPLWEHAMQKIPALEHYFRIIIQNHLVATQKRLLQSLAETAEEKYNRFLATYPECVQRVSQHMVASYLGVTRETLSRVRRQLADRK